MNDIDAQANGLFLAFESQRIPRMAQAVLDSGYLRGECTYKDLQDLFKERGLGANNVGNFLRYAETLKDPEP